MEGNDVARRTIALILFVVVAVGVLIVAPAGVRLFIAFLALPLETLILASLLGGSDRRIPQP
jgi:hypothetical protein